MVPSSPSSGTWGSNVSSLLCFFQRHSEVAVAAPPFVQENPRTRGPITDFGGGIRVHYGTLYQICLSEKANRTEKPLGDGNSSFEVPKSAEGLVHVDALVEKFLAALQEENCLT